VSCASDREHLRACSVTKGLNVIQFYVLPTQCIDVFCVDLRTNSDYFTVQHWLVGFYNWDGVRLLRGTDWVYILLIDLLYGRLVAVLTPRRPGCNFWLFLMRFVVYRVALVQVSLLVLWGFPLSVSFHHCSILIHRHVADITMKNGRSLGTLQKSMLFRKSAIIGWKLLPPFYF